MKKILNEIENNLSVIILAIILVVLSIQVGARFVFSQSFSWSEEAARYLFIWFSYLTACVCALSNTHICIDVLIKVWPKKIRGAMVILGNVLFFVYCLVLTYYGLKYTMSLYASSQVSLGLGLSMWIVYAAVPVSHALMAIRLVQLTVSFFKEPDVYLKV